MAGHRLDPIDRKILAELQADGRMTNVELAKRVGISAPPCLRRVRTLEEAGLVRGYHADVDSRALGSGFRHGGTAIAGRGRSIGVRRALSGMAAGARMPHAEWRGGFHPEMRGAGSVDLSDVSD